MLHWPQRRLLEAAWDERSEPVSEARSVLTFESGTFRNVLRITRLASIPGVLMEPVQEFTLRGFVDEVRNISCRDGYAVAISIVRCTLIDIAEPSLEAFTARRLELTAIDLLNDNLTTLAGIGLAYQSSLYAGLDRETREAVAGVYFDAFKGREPLTRVLVLLARERDTPDVVAEEEMLLELDELTAIFGRTTKQISDLASTTRKRIYETIQHKLASCGLRDLWEIIHEP